ncbi:GntR family transcriptional regulator [Helicovermis profundi]|uniref:GntR family transcriptional regulator n=1 Tax=Helicovermis profundi TaxID=3065157 RepID=A0AAU9E4B0_9FIRM|nr:GntR family transcriptional regulator [Clostridia bacterium S502]
MLFNIDLRSGKSINDQIVSNIKKLIVTEVIKPNEKLPSVRDLASTLTINPNTIQRAYKELELSGYIYSLKGKGSFVMEKVNIKDSVKIDEILKDIYESFEKAKFLGIPHKKIVDMVNKVYER